MQHNTQINITLDLSLELIIHQQKVDYDAARFEQFSTSSNKTEKLEQCKGKRKRNK